MAVGNVKYDLWVAKFYYPITSELEAQYYNNKHIEFDKTAGIVTIKGKDYECLLHDINVNIGDIHALPRSELLKMKYRFELFKNNQLVLETWYFKDAVVPDKVNLFCREYKQEDPPYRMIENLLRVVYKVSKFDREY